MRQFIAWKTHKGLKWYLFWDKECLDSKISRKLVVFNPHKSLPGRQLNTASRKSLEIHTSSIAKRRTLSNQNLFKSMCLGAVIPHETQKLRRIDSFLVWILVTSCENGELNAPLSTTVVVVSITLSKAWLNRQLIGKIWQNFFFLGNDLLKI